ncbi:SNF2 family N-terminal domain-containing protein [Paraphysoderma sedebokerense]|nr:SNF2 family N-terminal domain-containing protein [Paraphysoderma sedebokerense]
MDPTDSNYYDTNPINDSVPSQSRPQNQSSNQYNHRDYFPSRPHQAPFVSSATTDHNRLPQPVVSGVDCIGSNTTMEGYDLPRGDGGFEAAESFRYSTGTGEHDQDVYSSSSYDDNQNTLRSHSNINVPRPSAASMNPIYPHERRNSIASSTDGLHTSLDARSPYSAVPAAIPRTSYPQTLHPLTYPPQRPLDSAQHVPHLPSAAQLPPLPSINSHDSYSHQSSQYSSAQQRRSSLSYPFPRYPDHHIPPSSITSTASYMRGDTLSMPSASNVDFIPGSQSYDGNHTRTIGGAVADGNGINQSSRYGWNRDQRRGSSQISDRLGSPDQSQNFNETSNVASTSSLHNDYRINSSSSHPIPVRRFSESSIDQTISMVSSTTSENPNGNNSHQHHSNLSRRIHEASDLSSVPAESDNSDLESMNDSPSNIDSVPRKSSLSQLPSVIEDSDVHDAPESKVPIRRNRPVQSSQRDIKSDDSSDLDDDEYEIYSSRHQTNGTNGPPISDYLYKYMLKRRLRNHDLAFTFERDFDSNLRDFARPLFKEFDKNIETRRKKVEKERKKAEAKRLKQLQFAQRKAESKLAVEKLNKKGRGTKASKSKKTKAGKKDTASKAQSDRSLRDILNPEVGATNNENQVSLAALLLDNTADTVSEIETEEERNSSTAGLSARKKRGREEEEVGTGGRRKRRKRQLTAEELEKLEQEREEKRAKIWSTIAGKSVTKVAKIISQSNNMRRTNLRRISQLCKREANRMRERYNKTPRELTSKSKKAMREMLLFWKRNEREERELRKKAEKEALERIKREEELREARRQARKLNFLITQTELYSHFVVKKMGPATGVTDGSEVSEKDVEAKQFEEIDFDDDNEENLKEQAAVHARQALMLQQQRTRSFDETAKSLRAEGQKEIASMKPYSDEHGTEEELNFLHPSSMPTTAEIEQPKLLCCQLKPYQIKGMNWLANLYEQGINGILADEMGLGKTVQSISVLAHLAERHNIWGPFLVVSPASTLHNWQQEITRFVPQFKASITFKTVLPYWGNIKDRKILRQFWNKKQLYTKDAPFHVVITSYQIVVSDEKYFQRVKWQYMILDEAQAIKSSSSARWKILLNFNCRNRLLLTGTPIQNSMKELWALLHFIMPSLFDSHEEFSEWFSKDIESHAENKGQLNEHQLKRLHMILKPFMLRRVKKDVEHELGEKIELEISCNLTHRQKLMYQGLKQKISIAELIEKVNLGDPDLANSSSDNLMNLVMQFRKVCNHPELFERADTKSSFNFENFNRNYDALKASDGGFLVPYNASNPIELRIPKVLYRSGLVKLADDLNAGQSQFDIPKQFAIFMKDYINQSLFGTAATAEGDFVSRCFSFARFFGLSPAEISRVFFGSLLKRWILHLKTQTSIERQRIYLDKHQKYKAAPVNSTLLFRVHDLHSPFTSVALEFSHNLHRLTETVVSLQQSHFILREPKIYMENAVAPAIGLTCSDRGCSYEYQDSVYPKYEKGMLLGIQGYLKPAEKEDVVVKNVMDEGGMLVTPDIKKSGFSDIWIPDIHQLINSSGKLIILDKLLPKLKSEGHRCLVYFQMTKMIDIMEEYLTFRQYSYIRLDGSTTISDRRDLVQDWQTRPEIFIFLLSTRAGGLGINLTAADTVIFYDSDWNPTVDQQAMDRAHRLGQTKQVTIYRMFARGTIEERILERAKQKDEIQRVVISGGEFKSVGMDLKPREIVSLLLDSDELEAKLVKAQQARQVEDQQQKQKPKGRGKAKLLNDSKPTRKRQKKNAVPSTEMAENGVTDPAAESDAKKATPKSRKPRKPRQLKEKAKDSSPKVQVEVTKPAIAEDMEDTRDVIDNELEDELNEDVDIMDI